MQLKTALGLSQFQTDYSQTAAKSATDHRFLFVDLALVINSSDVPRTVWRAASLRFELNTMRPIIINNALHSARIRIVAPKKMVGNPRRDLGMA
jgi:hypothetical protein